MLKELPATIKDSILIRTTSNASFVVENLAELLVVWSRQLHHGQIIGVRIRSCSLCHFCHAGDAVCYSSVLRWLSVRVWLRLPVRGLWSLQLRTLWGIRILCGLSIPREKVGDYNVLAGVKELRLRLCTGTDKLQ
ncbi:hypothetical protein BIW11_07441 [Tropilaelaps mercedesae]|uniref:Uncharacterized protein n=1 Tax=Tropilaelaps mercedesae TaxID=418985 RepID=A0A1V9XU41_9ACAR|nr:hypothetical protein BIW11_07441 [Tropilaelaps mercedesae]